MNNKSEHLAPAELLLMILLDADVIIHVQVK